jgi:hypothetical protein
VLNEILTLFKLQRIKILFKVSFYYRDIFNDMKEVNEFLNSNLITELEINNVELKNEAINAVLDCDKLKPTLKLLKIKN